MGTPAAEIEIDARQARDLLAAQHPDLASLPIVSIASGWDNQLLRLGDNLALRFPRRQLAAQPDLSPPDSNQGERLAAFFEALHRPAPADAPCNPCRGVPLSERADAFAVRLTQLHGKAYILDQRILALWSDALAAATDTAPATWRPCGCFCLSWRAANMRLRPAARSPTQRGFEHAAGRCGLR
ncbi:MAG: hypothetical protein ABI356_07660 [Steroidobacteraceae bacterium]